MSARRQQRRANRGFTLVEVLVSLLVLGIGLLGVAKLVLFGSRSNDSAYLRSQATSLAYTLLDNMRSNRAVARTQAYDTGLGAYANPGSTCTIAGTPCTPAVIAQYDLYQWKQRLTQSLPSGDGSVVTAVNGSQVTATISVQWDDAVAQSSFGAAPSGSPAPVTVTFETVL
jgi:type IV pilus assembly protein PilV